MPDRMTIVVVEEDRDRAVAMALGLGGFSQPLSPVSVLSVNGNLIGVGQALEARLRVAGYGFDFKDAQKTATALAEGDIDAICVVEPWGSAAVKAKAGALLLPGQAIWAFAPEKVLAVRTEWAETEPHLLGKLMRAVWRAGRWLNAPKRRTSVAEILSCKPYL